MLQVSLIFVARFILTPQAERNAGEFLSYDPIVLSFFFSGGTIIYHQDNTCLLCCRPREDAKKYHFSQRTASCKSVILS